MDIPRLTRRGDATDGSDRALVMTNGYMSEDRTEAQGNQKRWDAFRRAGFR